jgi:hypothetical protein
MPKKMHHKGTKDTKEEKSILCVLRAFVVNSFGAAIPKKIHHQGTKDTKKENFILCALRAFVVNSYSCGGCRKLIES